MRPTTWLNNTRGRKSRVARDVNSSDGTGPPRPPPQFGTNDVYYGANQYSSFLPPHPIFHPAFHRSYPALDHSSLIGHPHAHDSYYAYHDPHRRPLTPHAPPPLGFFGQYGLRPDAIPFDPSSPLVAPSPSPLPAGPAPPTYRAPCFDDCGDDCPFADPYLPGWLERKAKEKESKTPPPSPSVTAPSVTASDEKDQPYSPLRFLENGGNGAAVLAPGWLERMVKARESRKQTSDTPQGFSDFKYGQHLAFSRSLTSTPALRDLRTSTSRSSTPGLPSQRIAATRSSTADIRDQHMSAFQPPHMAAASQHAFPKQNPNMVSARPLSQLLQSSNATSSEHLEQLRQAVKRAEIAKKTSGLSDSPCSSSNNSQQSYWSLEDVADDIQPEDSCSLFISGLPNGVTLSILLGSIRGYGRVRYSKIATSAALVVFFERNAAQRLAREGQLTVGEVQVQVRLAKKRVAQSTLSREVSRVLVITGFMSGLNVAFLKECLQRKDIQYELDKAVRGTSGGMTTLEWHFPSHAQAAKVMETIGSESYFWKKGVNVVYGIDPCAGCPSWEE